jgi:Uncharacterized protein conserved in bacteria (DUF2188)
MGSAEQLRVYVVYPAALFDGWEVVRENDDQPTVFAEQEQAIRYAEAQAALAGGAVVKLENWFGDLEQLWEVRSGTPVTGRCAVAAG